MADEVEHPEQQAEDALREAMRKLDAEAAGAVAYSEEQIKAAFQVPPYPQCSNGPDCQCPFHFGMERVRVCCAVCGLAGSHGDRMHIYTVYPDHTELRPGPDATGLEDFWPGYDDWRRDAEREQRALADAHEARLRRRRREIAEQPGRHEAGWQPGTCTGCGMSDGKIKGPAGAELCRWCDELRILAPAPALPKAEPERQQRRRLDAGERATVVSLLITLTGVTIVMFGGWWPLGVVLWVIGLLYGTKRR